MFRLNLFKIRAFTAGNIAGLLGALGRGGLQFMLIIWLQGIWLPQHGYSFAETPLWAGIYMIPLTVGFLLTGAAGRNALGPLRGQGVRDRRPGRLRGQLPAARAAADQLQLLWFAAAHLPVRGRHGPVLLPQPGRGHEQPPAGAARRGRRDAQHLPELGHRAVHGTVLHHRHSGPGLAPAEPPVPRAGRRGRAPAAARTVASEPPIGSLFSAFLGTTRSRNCSARPGRCSTCPRARPRTSPARRSSRSSSSSRSPAACPGLHLRRRGDAHRDRGLRRPRRRYLHAPEPVLDELAEGAAESAGVFGLDQAAGRRPDAARAPGAAGPRPTVNLAGRPGLRPTAIQPASQHRRRPRAGQRLS